MSRYNSKHQHHEKHKKLALFSSPLINTSCPLGSHSKTTSVERENDSNEQQSSLSRSYEDSTVDIPQFKRYEDPTLLEIFYDLFFAANYNVFSETLQVTNQAKFKASVGYFCLLWLTWFEVVLFDVRYVTDCIFSRVTRAIQLGVLVGFVVVAPKFNPSDQDRDTMRAMSLILCFSRACLAVEYGSVLWHVRKYKKATVPLCMQIGLHATAAFVYLGITFAFHEGRRSRVFMTWYFISGSEAIASVLISNLYEVASLTKTHIMKRMTLLTVMIMGEGLEQEAKEVVTIVRNPSAWDGVTIGLVTAAVATVYIVFLVYFDWIRSSLHLPPLRQQLWTCLHLPFHLSLVLFMQGFTQYLIWSKIVSQVKRLTIIADPSDDVRTATSVAVRDSLNASVQAFFRDYPPKIATTQETVNDALNNLTKLPDRVWALFGDGVQILDTKNTPPQLEEPLNTILSVVTTLVVSMTNALFAAFGINLDDDISEKNPAAAKSVKDGGYQLLVQDKTWSRYRLVFAYGYISAGCTMLLMSILTLVSRTSRLTLWPVLRLIIVCLLAIGTGLVSVLWFNEDYLDNFLFSPWVMPTITLVWVVVLVLTHINGESAKRGNHRLGLSLRNVFSRNAARKDNPPSNQPKQHETKFSEPAAEIVQVSPENGPTTLPLLNEN